MRMLTDEMMAKVRADRLYKLLTVSSSRVDARLAKDSEIFEKCIAGVHRRERAGTRREKSLCR